MAKCYYSYSFNLDDGLIMEEDLSEDIPSPMQAVGLQPPLYFDDFVDVWKSVCFPIFQEEGDEKKLSLKYFQRVYKQGQRNFFIEFEHNPLKNTYAAKYTRVNVLFEEEEETKKVRAQVFWEDNPELEQRKRQEGNG